MNYEQKYKEALERAKRMFTNKEIEYLFPELKENEDEKIRNSLIEHLKELEKWKVDIDAITPLRNSQYYRQWIAWLEKQKPVEEGLDGPKAVLECTELNDKHRRVLY